MKRYIKIALKTVVIIIILVFVTLIITPIFFKDDIMDFVKETIDESILANVDFKDIDISLIKNFPNMSVEIQELSVVNRVPFEGDTLVRVGSIGINLSLNTLFKEENDPYEVKYITISDVNASVKVLKSGVANYDITIPTDSIEDAKTFDEENITKKEEDSISSTSSSFPKINLQKYELKNINLSYVDEKTNMKVQVKDFSHSGSGDFTLSHFKLSTTTEMKVSFSFDEVNYLNDNFIGLYADFDINLENNKYTFLENKFVLNKVELNFDGFIKLLEEGQEYQLTFNTPSTNFKSFLEMIPEKYTQSLDGIETKGKFLMKGEVKGVLTDKLIPKFAMDIQAKDAMFKYPDLPKSVSNIQLETHIKNTTGLLNDTTIDVKKLIFYIGKDFFIASAFVSNVIDNMNIKATFKGDIDLAHIHEAYPMPDIEIPLKGKLKTNVATQVDMQSIEKNRYEKIKLNGSIGISNLQYSSDLIPNPVNISNLKLLFSPQSVRLVELSAKSGTSDFRMKGSLDNLLGFMFKEQSIKTKLNLSSNNFDVSDFMATETTTPTTTQETNTETTNTPSSITEEEESVKIPAFLDCTFNVDIGKVIYDDLTLNNTKGSVFVKNQTADLKNLMFNIFGGTIVLNTSVDTKPKNIKYKSDLKIKRLDVNKSFTMIKTLEKIAPIANSIDGFFNADLDIYGDLLNDYTPNLDKLSGKMIMVFEDAKFTPEKSKVLMDISKNVSFINLGETNINNQKIIMSIKDSKVILEPTKFKGNDITGTISGAYGFDQSIDYLVNVNVPVKHLGNDVNDVLKQADDPELMEMKVPVDVTIKGTTSKPKIGINMKNAMNTVAQQAKKTAVKKVKQQVKKEAEKLIENLFESASGGDKDDKKKKSTEEEIKEKASELLDGLFN